ncbi:MAG: thiamine pyrophosphate-binding protein [Anaerolineae bacterium]
MPTSRMTGGQAIVQTLKQEGVDVVFGIASVHMLPVYDALRDEPAIRLVVPRHEMAGGFMADGYSRVSGRPGVYLTSTGPGAANSAGAVVESWISSTRTLQLTGQVESEYLDRGLGVLHEVPNQLGMFDAMGACAQRIVRPEDAPRALHEAFYTLRAGRPRPYVLEMPIDQQFAEADIALDAPYAVHRPAPSDAELERASDILRAARRPALWVGGGVNAAGAYDELRRLAERLGAPIFYTRGGRGAIPDDHPLVIGNYTVDAAARAFIEASDGLIAVGTRFSHSSTARWQLRLPANTIRIDLDAAQAHRDPAAVTMVADAGAAMAELVERLGNAAPVDGAYAAEYAALRETLRAGARNRWPLNTAIMDTLRDVAPRETVFVADSTLPAYWGAHQYLPVYARRGYVYARSVAIGPGYPMALGAQLAAPEQPVVCIAGDGGFMMHASELATAVENNLPVVLCLFNNQGYGMIRHLQNQQMQGRQIGVDLHTPDFLKLADAFGVSAERVTETANLASALERAFAARRPVLLDLQIPFDS